MVVSSSTYHLLHTRPGECTHFLNHPPCDRVVEIFMSLESLHREFRGDLVDCSVDSLEEGRAVGGLAEMAMTSSTQKEIYMLTLHIFIRPLSTTQAVPSKMEISTGHHKSRHYGRIHPPAAFSAYSSPLFKANP